MKAFLTLQECTAVFQRAYVQGAVVAVAAFCLGTWGFSILGLVLLLAFLSLALGTMHNGLARTEVTKEISSRDASKSLMPKDGETTEWLSHTMVRIWTAYRQSLENRLAVHLQFFLEDNKPGWVDSFTSQGLQLGALAPEIHNVWVLTPQKASNLEMDLLMDVSIQLPGFQWDLAATLHPVKVNVPLQVRDVILKGKMLMKFRYQVKVPYVEKMWMSFVGQPDFHFSSKVLNLLHMNDVPVLRTFLDNLIRDSLKLNMVHPQRWLIDVNNIWHGNEPNDTEVDDPIAILVPHFPTTQRSIAQQQQQQQSDSPGGVAASASAYSLTTRETGHMAGGERISDEEDDDELDDDESSSTAALGPLVQSIHRADMKLTCWLAPFAGCGRRTLLVKSLSDEVRLILKARTDDGRDIWSTGKAVDTSKLMSQPTRVVFNVKGRSLTVEVKLYRLQSQFADGASPFDSPLPPTLPGCLADVATSTASSSTATSSISSDTSTKVNSVSSSEVDVRNLRKKIDDKMSNMMGNTLRSLVRSRDKTTTLGSFVSRATQILKSISVPANVFNKARGIAIMSMYKVGLVLGVRSGAGILLLRDGEGVWSPPTALWIGGMSAGLEGGAQSVDIVVVINNDEGMEAFSKRVLVLGMDVNLLPGPLTDEETDGSQSAPLFWYTFNKGVQLSLSLRGTVITEHRMLNRRFYGRNARAVEILQSKPMRELVEVQQLHTTLHDVDSITGADIRAAPQKFLDLAACAGASSEDSGELGGVVHFTVQTVTDVILPETAELSCLIHRDARLVAQCRLDRQGAGEWTVSSTSAAQIHMVVSNTACCILQLTVVSEIDGTRQVVGSTAMDVDTCLNSVESVDGRIVLQLGPSVPEDDSAQSHMRRDDSRASSGDEDESFSGSANSLRRLSTPSPGLHEPCSRVDSLPSSSPRLAAGSLLMRLSKSDTDACLNHSAHTPEWIYNFVHQNNLCRDFKHHLRTIPSCFMVREVVEQLLTLRHFEDRLSAVAFLQTLLPTLSDEGIIHSVGGESANVDDKKPSFFRFHADEMFGAGKGGKDRKHNIPGFSRDESTTVHWQKWVSRRDGSDAEMLPMDSKSDKLIKRSFEAAKEIIMRNRKKDEEIMLPQVHGIISFRRAEGLAVDLDDQNTTADDFLPYKELELEEEEEDFPFLQHKATAGQHKATAGPKFSNPMRDTTSPTHAEHNLPMISQLMADSLIMPPVQMSQDQVISLTVLIKQGRNLKPKGGICDAYVKVRVESEKVYRTKTIKKSATPTWDEEFKVKMISRMNGSIDFQVKDWNPISDDTILGIATLYLDAYFGQQDIKGLMSKTVHLPMLAVPSKKPMPGQLTLRVTAQPAI